MQEKEPLNEKSVYSSVSCITKCQFIHKRIIRITKENHKNSKTKPNELVGINRKKSFKIVAEKIKSEDC